MSKNINVELLPVLLNGKPYTIDPSGQIAINQDGRAVFLEEQEYTKSRFK